jgi:starch phosphorylase
MQNEVIPLFHARGPDDIPHLWLQRVKASMRRLIPQFSAERMMREYVEKLYNPQPSGRAVGAPRMDGVAAAHP